MKLLVFSDIHVAPFFSARTLTDKRMCGFTNAVLFRSHFHKDAIGKMVQAGVKMRPDVIVFAGDAVSTADPREFETALRELKPLIDSKIPILYSPGNHDRYVRAHLCRNAMERFTEALTVHCPMTRPGIYETGELRFAVLDSALPTKPWLSNGILTKESQDFLKREATKKDERPIVCVSHFPFLEEKGEKRHGHWNTGEILPLIEAQKIALVIAGHRHKPHTRLDEKGYGEIVTGSLTKHDIFRMVVYEKGTFRCESYHSDGTPYQRS